MLSCRKETYYDRYDANDYVNYRLQKAKETIEELEILIQNKLWNTAINRMYYASFVQEIEKLIQM